VLDGIQAEMTASGGDAGESVDGPIEQLPEEGAAEAAPEASAETSGETPAPATEEPAGEASQQA